MRGPLIARNFYLTLMSATRGAGERENTGGSPVKSAAGINRVGRKNRSGW